MLIVNPVNHADVPQCVTLRTASLGSLVIGRPPPYPGYIKDQEASLHKDIDNKRHVHNLKVVDSDDECQIIAYAKWEVYPCGRQDLEDLQQPMDESNRHVDRFGLLREAAQNYFSQRNGEMGKHPHLCKFLATSTI